MGFPVSFTERKVPAADILLWPYELSEVLCRGLSETSVLLALSETRVLEPLDLDF